MSARSSSDSALSRMLPFCGFGMGFGIGYGCGVGVGLGIGGVELSKFPGLGGFGGCGLGVGYAWGWFLYGWGVPYRRITHISGQADTFIQKRCKEEMKRRKDNDNGKLIGEQIDEDAEIEQAMREVLQSMNERRQRMLQRRNRIYDIE